MFLALRDNYDNEDSNVYPGKNSSNTSEYKYCDLIVYFACYINQTNFNTAPTEIILCLLF